MKIATRHTLMTLAWVGLLLGSGSLAAGQATSDWRSDAPAEVVPPGAARSVGAADQDPQPTVFGGLHSDDDDSVVGAHESPSQGLFGETAPGVCEFCGGGKCAPSPWSVDASIRIIGTSRANNHTLGINSLPYGPVQVTSGTLATQPLQYAFVNGAIGTPIFEVHTLNPDVSAGLQLTFAHFLGRDGERRDHFLEFEFDGLDRFSDEANVQGTIIPVYDATSTRGSQTPDVPYSIIRYTGSIISPFVFPQQPKVTSPFVQPTIPQNYDPTNAYAFNGATSMTASTWSTYNSFEINYRIAGSNQQDQMVLNPNGHWYRQCKSGFFYSYLFGVRAMLLDEMFEYTASGQTYNAANNVQTDLLMDSHGRYVVRTQNFLLGLQTGGTLEYRLCRWSFDTHSKVGMFMNVANQDSLIQTSLHGFEYNNPNADGTLPAVDSNTSTPYNSGSVAVAFAGGFGVGGSYKFRPNLVGRASYDMFWVGDIARAAEQMQFGANITPQIDTKGAQFYDGMTLGLEYDW